MTFNDFCKEMKSQYPDFDLRVKDTSFFMKVLNVLLLIVTFGQQKEFMTGFITTIGYTVYVPRAWLLMASDAIKICVLRHERVHMHQRRKYGSLLFSFLYLVPLFPLGLAYFRARFEWEAYTESMQAAYEYFGASVLRDPNYKNEMVAHFTTGEYGWMWPFRRTVESWYDDAVKKIVA